MEEPDVESIDFVVKRSLLARNKLAFILTKPDGLVSYCCVECSAKYDRKEDLEGHILIHTKEYRFLCGICGAGLKRREHLDRHTMEHQEVRPYACPECGKAFKRKEHLNIHMSIHSGDKSETCPVCNKSFYRRDHLRKHLQTHTKAFLEGTLRKNSDQVYVEIKQEAQDEMEEDIPIEILNETIVTEERPIVIDSSRPFMCPICQKSYKRKDHLKIHSWTHKEKEFVCTECGKAFHRQNQLFSHMSIHMQAYSVASGDEEQILRDQLYGHIDPENYNSMSDPQDRFKCETRPHACHVCQRRFKRKQHLKAHMNVHAKDHPTIWCSMCGEGFLQNQAFETHRCQGYKQENMSENYDEEQAEEMENPPQEMPLDAKKENTFPEEFVDVSILAPEDTKDDQVMESELPIPQRVFVCKYCCKPFKRKDHYKIHLNIHTGVKSFFCPDCGKGFYRKDHLQKHVLVHLKMRPIVKKDIPGLYPINMLPKKKEIKPEITIHAPSSTKLRVPLQIKVPYQMVVSMDNGEQRAVTIDPQDMDDDTS